jgi:hypothetical protein
VVVRATRRPAAARGAKGAAADAIVRAAAAAAGTVAGANVDARAELGPDRSLVVIPGCRIVAAALMVVAVSATAARAAGPHHQRDRALREIAGRIQQTREVRAEGDSVWIDAVLDTGAQGRIVIRIAPREVLKDAGFRLGAGDRVVVRYFLGEAPVEAQRIRNLETGRVLQVRCLHGEPTWEPAPHHRQQRRGHGRRP